MNSYNNKIRMENLQHFADDEEKMEDFKILTKEEFLFSYSYLTEEEYDMTAEYFFNNIKNIVYAGTAQGWSYDNILGQIKYAIATKEEADMLFICGEDTFPKLTEKAEKLYKEYREEYYKEN